MDNINKKLTEEGKKRFQWMSEASLEDELYYLCSNDSLEMIKYLLNATHPQIVSNMFNKTSIVLIYACQQDNLELVKYLLTSPELKEHADIHVQDDRVITEACSYGYLDIVKYLLTSPDLKEHANIHARDDCIFNYMSSHKQLDIIEYLVFEYNIDKTITIKNYLINGEKLDIIKLFDKRDLIMKLDNKLNINQTTSINKIKI